MLPECRINDFGFGPLDSSVISLSIRELLLASGRRSMGRAMSVGI
jgi:hypothetical protein